MINLVENGSVISHKSYGYALNLMKHLVVHRLQVFFNKDTTGFLYEAASLKAIMKSYPFKDVFSSFEPSDEEFLIFLIALIPHLDANFYNILVEQFMPDGGELPEFGGVRGTNFRGVLPTGETAIFLLGCTSPEKRLGIQKLMSPEGRMSKFHILYREEVPNGEPLMSGKLVVDPEIVERFTFGGVLPPKFSNTFGAELISTHMEWEDLVLSEHSRDSIRDIEIWLKHHHTFFHEWGMNRSINPGFRALFYGPPGTGKTLTAMLLGKLNKCQIYRIDISKIVSKYVGETEKNLAGIFNKALHKNWILFFDEADAIFGKRTQVKESQDKYANQEVGYLLQRIEQYEGLVILATNFKSNIDAAFFRRFQSVVYFPLPNPEERLLLWKKSYPKQIKFAPDVDLTHIAQNYEISGSMIINVVQFTCLRAIERQDFNILNEDIEEALYKEYQKMGKAFS